MHDTSLSCESFLYMSMKLALCWTTLFSCHHPHFHFIHIMTRSISLSFWTFAEYAVLPLVTFVKWDQGQCSAPSGEIGNCLPASDCQLRGGIAAGQCAGGLCVVLGRD